MLQTTLPTWPQPDSLPQALSASTLSTWYLHLYSHGYLEVLASTFSSLTPRPSLSLLLDHCRYMLSGTGLDSLPFHFPSLSGCPPENELPLFVQGLAVPVWMYQEYKTPAPF